MNKKVIGIPTDKILPAGRSLGIEPNLLSGLSGFPESAGTCEVEREWEELLPVLLAPGKVSMLMKGDRKCAVTLTSLSVVDGKILAYSGESDGNTYIQATDPLQLREELMASIRANIPGRDIVLPMSLDALFALAALSDFIKRQKTQNMLGQTDEPTPPTVNELQSLLGEAEKGMDPRWWLTPFLFKIYSPNRRLNVSEALKQLQELELTEENEGIVYLTAAGFTLADELTYRRGIVGFHSYYFEDGKPVQSTQVFLGTFESIWLLECGEKSVLSSLSDEAAEHMIEQALVPGEAVPKGCGAMAPEEAVPKECGSQSPSEAFSKGCGAQSPGQEYGFESLAPTTETNRPVIFDNAAAWLCSCGKKNNGNFCISCGNTKVKANPPPMKKFCRNCGSELNTDAQFCVDCGQKLR